MPRIWNYDGDQDRTTFINEGRVLDNKSGTNYHIVKDHQGFIDGVVENDCYQRLVDDRTINDESRNSSAIEHGQQQGQSIAVIC